MTARARPEAGRGPLAWTADETSRRASPAVFLDRDGVLNHAVRDPLSGLPESPLRPDDVTLLPGVAGAARALADAGFALVCVSNQPAAAKGTATVESLIEVHQRLLALLESEGVVFDAWRLCLHHPEGVVQELSGRCSCRKPAPGMLLDAAQALEIHRTCSWTLGDTDTDVEAGRAAGTRTALIAYPGSSHKRNGGASPDLTAVDLPHAVEQILDWRTR